MKFLALEIPGGAASPARTKSLLVAEAGRAWELHKEGILREAYFTPEHDAVLILECADERAARAALGSLPLVRERQIAFDLRQLMPYTGFERLFGKAGPS